MQFLGKTLISLFPASFRIPRPNLPITQILLTEWYMDHIRKTSHGLLASLLCISGMADVSGCGHRLHSRGVGMPGPRSAEIVQERDVRELQEPGLLG